MIALNLISDNWVLYLANFHSDSEAYVGPIPILHETYTR